MKRSLIAILMLASAGAVSPARAACPPVQIMSWTHIVSDGGAGVDPAALGCMAQDVTGQPVDTALIHPAATALEVLANLPAEPAVTGILVTPSATMQLVMHRREATGVPSGETFGYWASAFVPVGLGETGQYTATVTQGDRAWSVTASKPR